MVQLSHGSKCGYVGATKGGVAHVRRQARSGYHICFIDRSCGSLLFVGFRQYVGAEWVGFEPRSLAWTPKSFFTSDWCTLLKYSLFTLECIAEGALKWIFAKALSWWLRRRLYQNCVCYKSYINYLELPRSLSLPAIYIVQYYITY